MENAKFINDEYQLRMAILTNHIDLVKELLKKNVNINVTNNYGDTPLSLAIANGNLDMVRLLIESGSDVNYTDPTTDLNFVDWCVELNLYEVIDVFLEYEEKFDLEKRKSLRKVRLHTLFI